MEKTDDYSGHYIIARSWPPEHRPLERRTLVPISEDLHKEIVVGSSYVSSYLTDKDEKHQPNFSLWIQLSNIGNTFHHKSIVNVCAASVASISCIW